MIKRLALLALVCALVLSITGCARTKGPTDTIAAFQTAFNHYDLDGMLDCVEPEIADTVRLLLSSEGENYSLNASLIFALIKMGFPILPFLTDGAISNEDLPKITLDCEEAVEGNDAATVPVNGVFTLGRGTFSFNITVSLEREDGTWFITGISSPDTQEEAL